MKSEKGDKMAARPIGEIETDIEGRPRPWSEVRSQTPEDADAIEAHVFPYSVHDQGKAAFVRAFWLACTQAQVDKINAALPSRVRVAGRKLTGGGLALSFDLLTDSKEGQTYAAARHLIRELTILHRPDFVAPVITGP